MYKNLRCGNSHMAVPLRALTVRTSLFTCKCSQVYIFQIIEVVYKPIVCKLTYVCALASAHTSNLFVYMQISTNIQVSYDGHFCIRTYGAETYICLCPCERSQLEPLCLHANAHKYAFFRSQHLLYTNPLRANSHMSVPSRVLTLRTLFDTCKCLQIFIYRVMDTFVPEPTVRKLTYGCALASAHS